MPLPQNSRNSQISVLISKCTWYFYIKVDKKAKLKTNKIFDNTKPLQLGRCYNENSETYACLNGHLHNPTLLLLTFLLVFINSLFKLGERVQGFIK